MPRSLTRISLAWLLLVASEAWALGLGEIRLDSALNEPLRAEIELLAASPEELANLTVGLASADTFDRYGLDRPFYLQSMNFEVVRSGRADGNYIRVRSTSPMREPFLTFLVEVSWSRGRLLREYTVLLDPPTFAPPSASQPAPQVSAPQRSAPTDSGAIERAPEQTRPRPSQPAATPPRRTDPKPLPVADDTPYDATPGGDYVVRRGETLWGIATAMRPDSRLTMNQTMLAIYEANPQAFGGNINMLREGARLRLPSADEIYRIDRRDALNEVQRQNESWDPRYATAPSIDDADTGPSLTLVPPDEEPVGVGTGDDTDLYGEPRSREDEILDRIAEIEAADVPVQPSLIEIRDNELANLRRELAEIRGEVYEPVQPVEPVEPVADTDDPFVEPDTAPTDIDDIRVDDSDVGIADDAPVDAADEDADAAAQEPAPPVTTRRRPEPSLMEKALGWLTSIWAIIGGALLLVLGVLFWFMRRGRGEETDSWGAPLDADDIGGDTLTGTESMRAPTREDESFVVVEQETAHKPAAGDTLEMPAQPDVDETADTGSFGSLEDTFSSDTAINLDQSDPIAEADFHMAYGLYDQAADLINGALEVEPERQDLLTKLCEIYFVWGNRDAFVDAAERLQSVTGGQSADWDKTVIMGQQIASDHPLFAGAGVVGATKEVDLSFESDGDTSGALDMDFGDDSGGADVIDLGAGGDDDDGVDFLFDDTAAATDTAETVEQTADFSPTSEMPTIEQPAVEPTVEMQSPESTVETPTIEEQFTGLGGTSELPSVDDEGGATAEIDLDDLGLDLGSLDETEVATLDDDDLAATGTNEALEDASAATGKNPQVDPNATGVQERLDPAAFSDSLNLDEELASTGEMRLAPDETGVNPMADSMTATDGNIDESLLDATGKTQVLSEDMAVDTITPDDVAIGDDDKTMLAPGMGDDDEDFDFAKTEALPPDAYSGDFDPDATGELPAIGGTDVDLDLDDLTAALQVSDLTGDTVEQQRDDATVEQPRPAMDDPAATQELSPDDMSEDLHEARTMTEVGTKLDLARAYVDMGDPAGARSILEEVLDEGDEGQRQQAQQLLDSLPS
ncbi:MAG: FimV/HubP family polar landmark protein [Woeseiaceae bacterium]|nr:FimV/HubP family polar landmark protein [Woeseiaceae bacterium]